MFSRIRNNLSPTAHLRGHSISSFVAGGTGVRVGIGTSDCQPLWVSPTISFTPSLCSLLGALYLEVKITSTYCLPMTDFKVRWHHRWMLSNLKDAKSHIFLCHTHTHTHTHTLYRARTQWTFWTLLTIQYGVTLSCESYVKCYGKIRVLGCNGNTLRWSLECPNHEAGHLDKDSIWTPVWVEPPPLVRYKSSELRLPSAQACCTTGHAQSPAGLPPHWTCATTAATCLETDTSPHPPVDATRDWDFPPDACFACF